MYEKLFIASFVILLNILVFQKIRGHFYLRSRPYSLAQQRQKLISRLKNLTLDWLE